MLSTISGGTSCIFGTDLGSHRIQGGEYCPRDDLGNTARGTTAMLLPSSLGELL